MGKRNDDLKGFQIVEDSTPTKVKNEEKSNSLKNCLINKKIEVRHVNKQWLVNDPNHVLSFGMANDSIRYYSVPINESGMYAQVLTEDEERFLENYMGLEQNALSRFRKNNNYWENRFVALRKTGNVFDLSNPDEYIFYKILLSNKDSICPSLADYRKLPKATYEFIIINNGDEAIESVKAIDFKMEAFKKLGEIYNDFYKLKFVSETFTGRPYSDDIKIEHLKIKADELCQNNPKKFLQIANDKFIDTKILLSRAVSKGIVVKRADFYYIKDGNVPLCNNGEDSTIENAVIFLNLPANQSILFNIESAISN